MAMHNTPFRSTRPPAGAPATPLPSDGVSADAAPEQVASFLGQLDTVGDGLTILTELLDALRGEPVKARSPAKRPTAPVARPDLPPPAPDHRRVLKDHQELFSLLRRIAQREIQEPAAPRSNGQAPREAGTQPAQMTPPGLFLGKLDVPPVHPQYLRQAGR